MYTIASDVYSFGLIIGELLTGKKVDGNSLQSLYDDFNFKNEVGVTDYKNLMMSCCNSEPANRPNFEKVLVVYAVV